MGLERVTTNHSHRVKLHYKCLGAESSKDGKFVDYKTMMNIAGVKIAPAYLKMDIEGWEWAVLRSMVAHVEHLLPGQIAVSSLDGLSQWTRSDHADPSPLWRPPARQ